VPYSCRRPLMALGKSGYFWQVPLMQVVYDFANILHRQQPADLSRQSAKPLTLWSFVRAPR
jgi:hypothetical protein